MKILRFGDDRVGVLKNDDTVVDVRGITASRLAAIGFNQIKDEQSQEGLEKSERAAELNPEVELYVMQVDFMISGEAEVREDISQRTFALDSRKV